MVLEGGSIHVDGEGTCITTAECLLNHNRNPSYSKEEVEEKLKQYLNVDKVIWLRLGLQGSYVNFYMPNGGIVAPAFGDAKRDKEARMSFKRRFLNARSLSYLVEGTYCLVVVTSIALLNSN